MDVSEETDEDTARGPWLVDEVLAAVDDRFFEVKLSPFVVEDEIARGPWLEADETWDDDGARELVRAVDSRFLLLALSVLLVDEEMARGP